MRTIWFTGLPCSGKTTLAAALKEELDKRGYKTVHLDGDVVRAGINKGLGFSSDERRENLKRVAHMARDLSREGNPVIASSILCGSSPPFLLKFFYNYLVFSRINF